MPGLGRTLNGSGRLSAPLGRLCPPTFAGTLFDLPATGTVFAGAVSNLSARGTRFNLPTYQAGLASRAFTPAILRLRTPRFDRPALHPVRIIYQPARCRPAGQLLGRSIDHPACRPGNRPVSRR